MAKMEENEEGYLHVYCTVFRDLGTSNGRATAAKMILAGYYYREGCNDVEKVERLRVSDLEIAHCGEKKNMSLAIDSEN